MTGRRPLLAVVFVLVAAVSLWWLATSDGESTAPQSDSTEASATTATATTELTTTQPTTTEPSTARPASTATAAPVRYSELPVVSFDELPPEAIETLSAIASGGPFPFDRDDTVFQNREGLLPDHPVGHYREYTVITPGEDDRGARRIVAGDDGGLYYTADHYSSFREVIDQ